MARSKRRKKPGRARLVFAVLAASVVAALGAVAYLLIVFPDRPMGGPARSFEFQMPSDLETLSARLHEEKAIERRWLYAMYHRLVGGDAPLREGTVLLARNLTPEEILRRVVLGRGAIPRRVVIPEGMTRFDIARRMEDANICPADRFLEESGRPRDGAPSREGFLFPDTYDLRENTSAVDVVARLEENFEARTGVLFDEHQDALATLQETLGMGRHEVVVLASVVEREAAVASERPIIAGVFLNRLRSDTFRPLHRLQADPTVAYGCMAEPENSPSCAEFDGRATRALLQDSSNRYNTYRHGGLPPGPIANPGLDAIEAVLAPAPHDYLYFVARGGGRHAFAADLETHNANVNRYLR